jgi:hypothetical protein
MLLIHFLINCSIIPIKDDNVYVNKRFHLTKEGAKSKGLKIHQAKENKV